MIIVEVIILWVINSFKWFAYISGFALLYFSFSKEKIRTDEIFNHFAAITLILWAQPMALANTFNYYGIEGKIVAIFGALSAIPALVATIKLNNN